jgi:hypothetical protein
LLKRKIRNGIHLRQTDATKRHYDLESEVVHFGVANGRQGVGLVPHVADEERRIILITHLHKLFKTNAIGLLAQTSEGP